MGSGHNSQLVQISNVFYSDLISTVESGGQVDAVYTALKKTFDTVSINIL